MNITFDETILARAPGIHRDVRVACELVFASAKPSRIEVRDLRASGMNGRVLTKKGDAKAFVVEVGALDARKMFRTLIHELIHVAQTLAGKLKKVAEGWIWNDVLYPLSTPYSKRPWEIEAHRIARWVHSNLGSFV